MSAQGPLGPLDPGARFPKSSHAGLCPLCKHVKKIVSGRGSTFLRCKLAKQGSAFHKYPPQPVRVCPGFED